MTKIQDQLIGTQASQNLTIMSLLIDDDMCRIDLTKTGEYHLINLYSDSTHAPTVLLPSEAKNHVLKAGALALNDWVSEKDLLALGFSVSMAKQWIGELDSFWDEVTASNPLKNPRLKYIMRRNLEPNQDMATLETDIELQ